MSQNSNGLTRTIRQILPADGWQAVFQTNDTRDPLERIRLVCWALVDTVYAGELVQEVVGLVDDDVIVGFADETEDFVGYLGTGENLYFKFNQTAEERQLMLAHQAHQHPLKCS